MRSQNTPPFHYSPTKTLKSQRLHPLDTTTTSCIVIRIIALNINEDGRMFGGGFCKKKLYPITLTEVIALFQVAVSTNADISNDESRMAKDILLKPRVEATEQMTQNWTFGSPRISESAKITSKRQVCTSDSMFPFYFTPGNLS